MNERLMKLRLAIQNRDDAEDLRVLCLQLVELAVALDRRDPITNYRAMVQGTNWAEDWAEVATGSKDYCIGFLEADQRDGDGQRVVAVGSMIVWPEERWGDQL